MTDRDDRQMELAQRFIRDILRASIDEDVAVVARRAGEWARELPGDTELELVTAVAKTALNTVGGLVVIIRGMRRVSPLADELAIRLVDLNPEAVDEAIEMILSQERGNQ